MVKAGSSQGAPHYSVKNPVVLNHVYKHLTENKHPKTQGIHAQQ